MNIKRIYKPNAQAGKEAVRTLLQQLDTKAKRQEKQEKAEVKR